MNTKRNFSEGIPYRCRCAHTVVIFYSKTNENRYRRIYRCEIGLHRKKENHLLKWCDEGLLDENRRVDVEQRKNAKEIEDLKLSLKKTVEEEVRKRYFFFLESILWLFGKLSSQE
ncbi:hypothetical protein N665_0179s0012 [Sinapis alba]|nr:hypothetical protein N665_0179s0012 [Sinapis alba]